MPIKHSLLKSSLVVSVLPVGFLIALTAFAAVPSRAAVIETSFVCPEFIIPGTVKPVSGAEVKSYNTVTHKAMVKFGKQIKMLPLEALPAEIQKKLTEMLLPPPTDEEVAANANQDAAFRNARQGNSIGRETQIGRDALEEARYAREEARRLAVRKAEMEMEEQIRLKRQIAAMASYARNNFYGSNALVLGAPEEVPGWPGQWRVRGEYDCPVSTNGRNSGYKRKDWSMIMKVDASGLIQTISVEK